jgi:hypothetical protein
VCTVCHDPNTLPVWRSHWAASAVNTACLSTINPQFYRSSSYIFQQFSVSRRKVPHYRTNRRLARCGLRVDSSSHCGKGSSKTLLESHAESGHSVLVDRGLTASSITREDC